MHFIKMLLNIMRENLIYQNVEYLKKGEYRLFISQWDSKAIVYNKNYKNYITQMFSHENQSYRYKVKKQIVKIFNLVFSFHTRGNSTMDLGQALMFTRKKNIKFFDFEHERVYYFLNKEDYRSIKRHTKYFSKYYPTTIKKFYDDYQLVEEHMIHFKSYEKLNSLEKRKINERLFQFILEKNMDDKMCGNYKLKRYDEFFAASGLSEEKRNYLLSEEWHSRKNMLELNALYPYVLSHGDLNFDNILFCEDNLFIIDYEDVGWYIFYYDLFDPYFMLAMRDDDYIFFRQLYNGVYDQKMSKIFTSFDLKYRKNHISIYIILYYLNKISNLKKIANTKNFILVSNIYRKTLTNILTIKKLDEIKE